LISKENLKKIWSELLDSPRAKQVQKVGRRIVIAAIVGIIIYQLFDIGWSEVLRNLPTAPLFYLIFLFLFITLPLAEVFIYGQVWSLRKWSLFKSFLTKRVYNDEVMGYSGEFFLFMWARKHLDKGDKEILKNIRDNNILSALSSNLVVVSLLGILTFTGIIDLEELVGNVNLFYLIIAAVIFIILLALITQFRKYFFDLPLKKAFIVFLIYFWRFIIHNAAMMLMWAVAIPGIPLTTWFVFIAINLVVNRIPFMPSRDLVFLMAGIELSRVLEINTAAVAGMLLVYSALKKILNLVLFMLIEAYSKKNEKMPSEPGSQK
jgi:hypothetical protein